VILIQVAMDPSLTSSPPLMTTLTGQVQATLILGLQEMK